MRSPQGMSHFYKQMGHAANVMNANPHELVDLLLSQARNKIALALEAGRNHDLAERAQSIHRACAIVDALRMALDVEEGGEIANNLQDLYDYLYRRLLQASALNDESGLIESNDLLATLQEGWSGIAQQVSEPATAE